MAEAEGGSEQDDVSFLRTVRIISLDYFSLLIRQNCRKTWYVFRVQLQAKEYV